MYKFLIIKRAVEAVIIFPFIIIGRIIANFRPLRKEYRIFFFFPFYHTGGAEKVHAQIARAIGNDKCLIYFTRKSTDKRFLEDFIASGCHIKDISSFTDNKWIFPLNLIYRGMISSYINRASPRVIVFNGQSNFGYKISPWISKENIQVELIHALNTFSAIRIPYLQFYKRMVTVSQDIIDKHRQLYTRYKVPGTLFENFKWIRSKIELPRKPVIKDYAAKPLHVLFVGRDSFEKRPALVAQVARNIITAGMDAVFSFAGNVARSIPHELHQYCRFYGDVNEEKLNHIYDETHIVLISSTTESGPLVLMEGMARGTAIISTNVGYVSNYVKDDVCR